MNVHALNLHAVPTIAIATTCCFGCHEILRMGYGNKMSEKNKLQTKLLRLETIVERRGAAE